MSGFLAGECPIEWIITKSALQEGWDCPFAYILVSLNNTGSGQAMTQLVGRILRQPYQKRTPLPELNESYIYCLHRRAADVAREVKSALEKEGYEGDAASVVHGEGGEAAEPTTRTARHRTQFSRHYREFEGKIYLPRFCVRTGKDEYEKLDYFRHLLSRVDVDAFDFKAIDWDLSADLAAAKDQYYRITLGQDELDRVDEREAVSVETDEQVMRWMAVNLPFEWFSQKELRTVVQNAMDRVYRKNTELPGKLAAVRFAVRDRIKGFVERETDVQTEAAFKALFDSKKLCFYLECVECRFEIPAKVTLLAMPQLQHDNGNPVQRSLFDYIPNDLNEYERSVALYVDRHPKVLWWYRNLVGLGNLAIQGYRRGLIYPDFVVQHAENSQPAAKVLVLESKGKQLKGNMDTDYKRTVAGFFEKAGREVPWQKLAEEFADHTFRFQILDEGDYADSEWQDHLRRLLDESVAG